MSKAIVSKNKIVSIYYSMKDSEGNILYSNNGLLPLRYLHGHGNIIPGLENALEGMCRGDTKNITVLPEGAYGYTNKYLIVTVSVDDLKIRNKSYEIGDHLSYLISGKSHDMEVVYRKDEKVVLDGNHPLVGKTLEFDIEVIKISEATENEIFCGYPITDALNLCNCEDGCC